MTQPVVIWRSIVAGEKHGPLPALFLILTAATGAIDALCVFSLGRVFVANMSGNLIFVAFALTGSPGFSLASSLFALAGFLGGALGMSTLLARYVDRRAALFRLTMLIELVLLIVALVIAIVAGTPFPRPAVDAIVCISALAMGIQTTTARRMAVPDLMTTLLTMVLTGVLADVRVGEGPAVVARRLLALGAMLAGAVVGAFIIRDFGGPIAALGLVTGLVGVVAIGAFITTRRPADWQLG
jgi:uncharacterized membrane protein YoaK (UPF0700 family)